MKWLRRVGLAVLLLLLADQAVGWFAIRDGRFRGTWLPPLAQLSSAQEKRLREALARMRVDERQTETQLRVFDSELGWTNLPGETGYYATNSLGARSLREYGARPEPGVLRLVCYGESFTFGSEVPNRAAWPARLEESGELEAINMGVSAYGTDQALLRFRRRGTFGARVVLIGFLTENIGRNVNRYRPLYQLGESTPAVKPRFVLRDGALELVPVPYATRSELLRAVLDGRVVAECREHEYWRDIQYFPPFSPTARIFAGVRAAKTRRVGQLWNARAEDPFELTLTLLATFYREALEAGAEHALVLVFPTRSNLRQARRGLGTPAGHLTRTLAQRGIPALDLTDALLRAPDGATLYKTAHWNAYGNQLVATAVREWVDRTYPQR